MPGNLLRRLSCAVFGSSFPAWQGLGAHPWRKAFLAFLARHTAGPRPDAEKLRLVPASGTSALNAFWGAAGHEACSPNAVAGSNRLVSAGSATRESFSPAGNRAAPVAAYKRPARGG